MKMNKQQQRFFFYISLEKFFEKRSSETIGLNSKLRRISLGIK